MDCHFCHRTTARHFVETDEGKVPDCGNHNAWIGWCQWCDTRSYNDSFPAHPSNPDRERICGACRLLRARLRSVDCACGLFMGDEENCCLCGQCNPSTDVKVCIGFNDTSVEALCSCSASRYSYYTTCLECRIPFNVRSTLPPTCPFCQADRSRLGDIQLGHVFFPLQCTLYRAIVDSPGNTRPLDGLTFSTTSIDELTLSIDREEPQPRTPRLVQSHNYVFPTDPVGESTNTVTTGFELEVLCAGSRETVAQDLEKKYADMLFYKHDGSIGRRDQALEIVSRPFYWDWWEKNSKQLAQDLFDICVTKHGCVSHNAGTCGLHVHLGRFGKENMYRYCHFIQHNESLCRVMSRRNSSAFSKYIYPTRRDLEDMMDHGGDKYCSFRFTPNTLEVRFFRGTLRPSSFIASVEFCYALQLFVKEMETVTSLVDIEFTKWLERSGKFPTVLEYLRRLGVI